MKQRYAERLAAQSLKQRPTGFTLIEVTLVLAIAGLIMLIVFLALAGAQRARRDTQRKRDAGRILAAMELCSSGSNAGSYTNCVGPLIATYFSGTDPLGSNYSFSILPNSQTVGGFVEVNVNACDATVGAGIAHVRIYQESGSTTVGYCVDNK